MQYEHRVTSQGELGVMSGDGWRLIAVDDGNLYWQRKRTPSFYRTPYMGAESGKTGSASGPEVFYLAICMTCGDPDPARPRLPQPFLHENERDDWAYAHGQATGHEVLCATEARGD